MRRILLLLTVALVMAAMLAVNAAPAFARVSTFISSPTGPTLSLNAPNEVSGTYIPLDPYVPPNPVAPPNPLTNVPPPDPTTCDASGISPTCPAVPTDPL